MSLPTFEAPDLPFPDQPFLASEPINPELLRKAGCFTQFQARLGVKDEIAKEGIRRAVLDFNTATSSSYIGATLSDAGTMMGLAYFDCLPDRVKVVSYLNEIGFLYDDFTEPEEVQGLAEVHKRFDYACDPRQTDCPDDLASSLIMKKLLSAAILECLEIDQPLGLDMMENYSEQWLKTVDTAPPPTDSIDEFYRHRVRDSGTRVYWWMIVYGHGTRMTKDEFGLLEPLLHVVERVFLATNDFYSWHKEKIQPIDRITNAVLLFIQSEALCEPDAVAKLREFIIAEEARFLTERQRFCAANPNLPSHLKLLINTLEPAIAGFHYWAATCPRYKCCKSSEPDSRQMPLHLGVALDTGRNRPDVEALASGFSSSGLMNADGEHEHVCPITTTSKLDGTRLMAPIHYIYSTGSKNVRSQLLDAFNLWLKLPRETLNVIKEVVSDIHNSSLILDDIQDNSPLRRGCASTHVIFGQAQAINSATFMFVRAARRLHALDTDGNLLPVLFDALESLFTGQSWELHWKHTMRCPSEDEYFAMVDSKTGAMFHALVHLMLSVADCTRIFPHRSNTFDTLAMLLGRWYQVRDDYMNLQPKGEYEEQKGFCEDLDEGKFSYPVVRCCAASSISRDVIIGLFRQTQTLRSTTMNIIQMPHDSKTQILKFMEATNALAATRDTICRLQKMIHNEIGRLESQLAATNPILRLVLKLVMIPDRE